MKTPRPSIIVVTPEGIQIVGNVVTPEGIQIVKDIAGLSNLLVAATPGGIEAQEQSAQIAQTFAEELPRKIQRSRTDPSEPYRHLTDKQYLDKAGIKLLGPAQDQLFNRVELPKGWRKSPTVHSMWTDLLDARDGKRANIFFKGAFYDYDASISFNRRLQVQSIYYHGATPCYDLRTGNPPQGQPELQHDHISRAVVDNLTFQVLFETPHLKEIQFRDGNREQALAFYDQKDAADKTCTDWLIQRFPKYKDEFAYWDDDLSSVTKSTKK